MAKQRQSARSIAKDTRSSKPAAVKKGSAPKKQAGKKSAPARKDGPQKGRPVARRHPPSRGRAVRLPHQRHAGPPRRPPRRPPQRRRPPRRRRKPASTKRWRSTSAASRRSSATTTRRPPGSSARFSSDTPRNASCSSGARLYLRVCERETARQPTAPKTPAEWVYAATVALNSGDHTGRAGSPPARHSATIPTAITPTTSWPWRSACADARRGARPPAQGNRPEPGEPRALPGRTRTSNRSATTRASARP